MTFKCWLVVFFQCFFKVVANSLPPGCVEGLPLELQKEFSRSYKELNLKETPRAEELSQLLLSFLKDRGYYKAKVSYNPQAQSKVIQQQEQINSDRSFTQVLQVELGDPVKIFKICLSTLR